jgi:hypothetical protein
MVILHCLQLVPHNQRLQLRPVPHEAHSHYMRARPLTAIRAPSGRGAWRSSFLGATRCQPSRTKRSAECRRPAGTVSNSPESAAKGRARIQGSCYPRVLHCGGNQPNGAAVASRRTTTSARLERATLSAAFKRQKRPLQQSVAHPAWKRGVSPAPTRSSIILAHRCRAGSAAPTRLGHEPAGRVA